MPNKDLEIQLNNFSNKENQELGPEGVCFSDEFQGNSNHMDNSYVLEDPSIVMPETGPKITLIVKVTNKCNLDCPYCYNQLKAGWDEILTLEQVEEIAYKFKGHIGTWTWHGGEPTLMGIDWYRKAHKIIRDICGDIEIAIQSHGGTINQEWIDFYKAEEVSIGLSFDGYNNDNTRKNTRQLISNMDLLKQNGIQPSAILIITKENAHRLNEEYELFKKLEIGGMFNQVFEVHDIDCDSSQAKYVDSKNISLQICDHFDYWMYDKNNPMDVYLASRYLNMLFEDGHLLCEHINCTGGWAAIYPNGDLYPCGRDWLPEAKFGNLSEISSWEDFQKLQKVQKFKEDVKIMLNNECNGCPWYNSCKGGCYADAWGTEGVKKPHSNSCEATKTILTHIWNRIKDIDIEKDYDKYNPLFIRSLHEKGYRSLSFIEHLKNGEVK